jgi:hypothetical protein
VAGNGGGLFSFGECRVVAGRRSMTTYLISLALALLIAIAVLDATL